MCSIPLRENHPEDNYTTRCLKGISETSNTVTYVAPSNSNCRDRYSTDVKEVEKMENIIQKKDDLLPSNYLDNKIFGLLVPALEETLIEASKQNVLRVQKCRFNGLDYIAEILWNRNPRRSKIFLSPLNVFEIPSFKEYLRLHPRPYYPKSWLWSEDEAALYIQRYVRGWLVRKCSDVQEMRQFWKDFAAKRIFDKKERCIVQSQRLSNQIQNDIKHTIIDDNLIRCEKYRLMT
ncbi:PREDICTED: IQ domain-containing protein K-like [Eufriesea mexicana]|uniref:IQ domain-containing protein K-like n=1 Tax=Eufriesea mexicana TaxID=516756 RepID=UPI00083BF5CC|nr:PREDICTED: IQ domain-containing protein K-like [Eufriesea mexicana]